MEAEMKVNRCVRCGCRSVRVWRTPKNVENSHKNPQKRLYMLRCNGCGQATKALTENNKEKLVTLWNEQNPMDKRFHLTPADVQDLFIQIITNMSLFDLMRFTGEDEAYCLAILDLYDELTKEED